jgi:LysR family transcriptional regulator, glycine cleavage system transcriptional activator
MTLVSHLKALQALELAVRAKSLRAAADRLGITPAAVGQRIRALEDQLGTVLLKRGPSGLEPSAELAAAMPDLSVAFAALELASDALDMRRPSEIHIVADPDWVELWLEPRLPEFRAVHPNVMFNINGLGDVPMRLGTPDIRVGCSETMGEILFADLFVPVTGPDNTRRMATLPPDQRLEGMPLLHMRAQREGFSPGWVDWCKVYGHRDRGAERGVVYPNSRLAIPAVRQNIGFLVCSLSLCLSDLDRGEMVLPFPARMHLPAPNPYRMTLRGGSNRRPQTERFVGWLRHEAQKTADRLLAFGEPLAADEKVQA